MSELANDSKGKLIRVRDLVSCTPGYMAFNRMLPGHRFQNRDSSVAAIKTAAQIFWPGAVYNYDHSATALLGEILEGIMECSVPKLIEDMILSPLGITGLTTQAHYLEAQLQVAQPSSRHGRSRSLFGTKFSIPDCLSLVELLMSDHSENAKVACLSVPTLEALRKQAVEIPRTTGSPAWKLLPGGYGLGLQVYRNRFFGYDTSTRLQASGFRFDPIRQFAVVLVTKGRYRSERRAILSGILDLIEGAQTLGESDAKGSGHGVPMDIAEIVGHYFGNESFMASVHRSDGDVTFTIRGQRAGHLEMRGRLSEHGLVFESKVPAAEPTFFRYSRTGESCVMFGMFALKRLPLAIVGSRGMSQPQAR